MYLDDMKRFDDAMDELSLDYYKFYSTLTHAEARAMWKLYKAIRR